MPVFTLARLFMLLVAAGIHIYRGSTGQLQARGRSQRSQLFYIGLGIAFLAFLLSLFHLPMVSLAVPVGLVLALAGFVKPAAPRIELADTSDARSGVPL